MRTRRVGRYFTVRWLLPVAAALAGCSATSADAPIDRAALPESWQSRRPYRAADAAILAHDEREAQEAGRLIGEVAAEFRRRTGREPTPRLLVIVGSRDWLRDPDPCLELRLGAMGDAILAGRPEPSGAELARRCDELRDTAARVGLDPRTLLVLKPDVLASDGFVTQLGLPEAAESAFDWAIVVATEAELVEAAGAMVDAAVAKEDLSGPQRMLLAPLLPWVRGRAVEAARGAIKNVLFAAHASAQRDWSREERRREVDAYAKAVGVERSETEAPRPHSSN
jgi:hypothetical protein